MHADFHVKKYGFDRVFSLGASKPEVNPSDLQLQVLELQAEIERLKQERDEDLARARADGFEAGLVRARSDREAATLAAVDALNAALENVERRFEDAETRISQEAAEVALAAADFMAARALEQAPWAAIDQAIGRVLRQVRGQTLQVRVHPSLVADIGRLIEARRSQDRRRLSIDAFADETLAPGDAIISWEQGGLVLDAAARREVVRAELGGVPVAAAD